MEYGSEAVWRLQKLNEFAALASGNNVAFEGKYFQSKKEGEEIEMPFLIAQTEEQVAKLEEGILEGRIYELGQDLASVQGKVEGGKVTFEKKYVEQLAGSAPESITYSGEFADGKIPLKGSWSFEAPKEEIQFSNEGTFELEKRL